MIETNEYIPTKNHVINSPSTDKIPLEPDPISYAMPIAIKVTIALINIQTLYLLMSNLNANKLRISNVIAHRNIYPIKSLM